MGGSVIQLDIPRNTVSIVCNIKSTRGHTSINMTPWESRAQYKKWNQETYKPHDQASYLMDQFHAAERRARSIQQSRHLSLHHVARIGCIHPSHRSGPHQEHPAGHHTYHDEEDALVHHDLQRSGRLEDMPEDDWTGPLDRSARSPKNPPTYEDALLSLGRAPTMADLSPHRPDSRSSSLVPYDEDSNPDKDQNQLAMTPGQMETEDLSTAEAPVKEGMGIAAAPENHQPATPRYIGADEGSEDSEDGQDTDEEGDIEAPYLVPKQTPAPKPLQDGPIVQVPLKGKNPPAEDSQDSSGEESIPELIDLREGEEVPPPTLLKKANHPTTLELHRKIAVTSEKLQAFSFPPLKDHTKPFPAAAPKICPGEVPEEQIIYIDDDADPAPLQLLERQVDRLLMPPPSDTTLMAQKAPQSPSRDHQLLRMPERRRHSPGTTRKKTLQERQNGKSLKLKVGTVAKMHTGLVDTHHAQELAKLTSVVVPLQRLKIQDDSFLEVQKNKPEAKMPAPPQK